MSTHRPKYLALASELRDQLRSGQWLAGAALPAIRPLAARHGCSVVTVSHALQVLEREGWIEARRRARYRVARVASPPPSAVALPSATPVTDQLLHTVMRVMRHQDLEVPLGGSTLDPAWIPHRALRRSESHWHRRLGAAAYDYEIAPGLLALRAQLAQRLSAGGTPLAADEITVTGGCLEAISLSLDTCTRPGDAVMVESPTFFGLLQLLQRKGLRVAGVTLGPGGLSVQAVAAVLDRQPVTAACLTPNFSNPSGALTPVAEKRAIGQLLAARRVTLIEDDVYAELSHHGPRPPTMIALCPQTDVLCCGSVSKVLAPGLRLGWVARRRGVHGDRFADLPTAKFVTTLAAPTLAQHVVADWMQRGLFDRHLQRLRRQLPARVTAYREAILEHLPPGTEVSRPDGGFLLWVCLPRTLDPTWLIAAAQAIGVGLVPGSAFHARAQASPCLRLSAAGALDERVLRGLRELGALLRRDRAIP